MEIDVPIESNDPSLDRNHCTIQVQKPVDGEIRFVLSDNNSNTGTFLMNSLLGPKEHVPIGEGAIITLGATTLILKLSDDKPEA